MDVGPPRCAPRKAGRWRLPRRLGHRGPALLGGLILLLLVLTAIFAGQIAPYSYEKQFVGSPFQQPSLGLPFGADSLGRDQLSRVIYGSRVSLAVGIVVQAMALLIGVPLGAVAGYAGGWVDGLLMRFTDAMYAFPDLLFVIVLLAVLGRGEAQVFLAIGIVAWPTVARLVRGQFLASRHYEFVAAARVSGASPWRIITRHLLPHAAGPIAIAVALGVPSAILMEAVLAFLGLGAPPPLPSWGSLIQDGLEAAFTNPWLAIFPGLAISLTMLSFILLADALRDALDPRSAR
ncbi:MAG: ABC transporter permease [Chloroflexota bacterium]